MSLDGKVAVVTGSTSGIGLGIARTLATNGCSVVITGLGEATVIDALTKEFKGKKSPGTFIPCDLRYPDSIKDFCQKVKDLYPDGIDILVNNAGLQYVCNIDEYPEEKWNDMISITLTAPFHLIKNFLPAMKKKGWGRMVNISSQMGIISQVGKAPYSAAKAGLIGLTRGVALEAAPFGVTCNSICPSFANTPYSLHPYIVVFREQIVAYSKEHSVSMEEAEQTLFDKNPTKKPVEIQEIADLVLFLCSSGTKSITGSPILIDAGFTIQ